MSCHLVSIKKVERCPATALANTEQIFNLGILLKGYNDFEKIDIIGLASVEITDKVEDKQRVYTTKLLFKTASSPDMDEDKFCYRLTTVAGSQFLLGTKDRPYTLFSSVELLPDSPTDKTGCTCTVTYTNLFSHLSIID